MSDIFGGLSGLMKGLSGFMPQDDPNVKMLNAQTEISDLEKQEFEIYAEIGRQAYEANPDRWPQAERLKLARANLDAAKARRDALEREQQAEQKLRQAAEAALVCPNCDYQNPEGTKFCQECGTKLGLSTPAILRCAGCGAELAPGTRFCGECGAKQGG